MNTYFLLVPNIKNKYIKSINIEKNILDTYLDYNIFKSILEKNNYKDISNEDIKNIDYVDFMYIYGDIKYDTKIYNIKSKCKNLLKHETEQSITNKENLYKNVEEMNKKTNSKIINMCKTYNIDDIDKLPDKKTYIIRPIGGYKGQEIKIVNNNEEFKEYKEKYLEIINDKKNKYSYSIKKIYKDGVIISEYINKPLLFKEKKFHLRCYMIIKYINNKWDYSIFDMFKILTAEEKYKDEDYYNKKIHDTHLGSTDKDYFGFEDFNKNTINNYTKELRDKIKEQINKICGGIYYIAVKNGIEKYEEDENAFELFAPDIMIDENGNCILIEVNNRVGTSFKMNNKNKVNKFSKNFFNWLLNETIFLID